MKRLLSFALAAVVLSAGLAEAKGKRNDPAPRGPAAAAKLSSVNAPNASATYARIALVWDMDYEVVRSKGVSSVRVPSNRPGLYCIRPTGMSSATVRRLVPLVSVDYSGSSGDALAAYYRSSATGCYSNEIGIQTMNGDSGEFLPSDRVGFTLIVP